MNAQRKPFFGPLSATAPFSIPFVFPRECTVVPVHEALSTLFVSFCYLLLIFLFHMFWRSFVLHISFQQQLQAYVAWVNSQLKKKPGCHMVEDLRRDMQDGVALVHLVEIVCEFRLSFVFFLSFFSVWTAT